MSTQTTAPVDGVLGHLDGARRSGDGWSARCPAHNDKSPSLTVSVGDDERVLLHCHAGCTVEAVVTALGLTLGDLFPAAPSSNGTGRRIDRTYNYIDETGDLLYQVVRYDPKDFRQRRPNGQGWTWKLGDVRRVLYRLPSVRAAVSVEDTIYICEGEKDADALTREGVVATCNAGGAGKWRAEYSESLAGATVVVVADRDDIGRAHARTVTTSLTAAGCRVTAVEAAVGKDVSDHLSAGRSLGELVPVDMTGGDETGPDGASIVDRYAGARIDWSSWWATDLTATDWLCEPLLARGRGHALYARAKAGKSLIALEVAAALATGRAVLDQPAGPPTRVLYVDAEMTGADLRERLGDMGYGPDDDLSPLAYYQLAALPPLDTEAGGIDLVALAVAHRADLVVIDTLGRVLDGEENSADTVRAYYRHTGGPLKAAGITTARLDHAGKDADKGQRGSSAKADDVDVVWSLVERDAGRVTLRATHRRLGWVPETVELERRLDPLRHTRVADTWPAGTAEVAAELDRLGVPVDAGRRIVAQALRDAGHPTRTEVVGAAQRYRRATLPPIFTRSHREPGPEPPSPGTPRTRPGTTPPETPADQERNQPRNQSEPGARVSGNQWSSRRGDHGSTPHPEAGNAEEREGHSLDNDQAVQLLLDQFPGAERSAPSGPPGGRAVTNETDPGPDEDPDELVEELF